MKLEPRIRSRAKLYEMDDDSNFLLMFKNAYNAHLYKNKKPIIATSSTTSGARKAQAGGAKITLQKQQSAAAAPPPPPPLTKQQSQTAFNLARQGSQTHRWEFALGSGGWAAYDTEASKLVEMEYQSWLQHPAVSVRSVRSGDWHYSIDFNALEQTNIGHNSRRVRKIRRVALSAGGGIGAKSKSSSSSSAAPTNAFAVAAPPARAFVPQAPLPSSTPLFGTVAGPTVVTTTADGGTSRVLFGTVVVTRPYEDDAPLPSFGSTLDGLVDHNGTGTPSFVHPNGIGGNWASTAPAPTGITRTDSKVVRWERADSHASTITKFGFPVPGVPANANARPIPLPIDSDSIEAAYQAWLKAKAEAEASSRSEGGLFGGGATVPPLPPSAPSSSGGGRMPPPALQAWLTAKVAAEAAVRNGSSGLPPPPSFSACQPVEVKGTTAFGDQMVCKVNFGANPMTINVFNKPMELRRVVLSEGNNNTAAGRSNGTAAAAVPSRPATSNTAASATARAPPPRGAPVQDDDDDEANVPPPPPAAGHLSGSSRTASTTKSNTTTTSSKPTWYTDIQCTTDHSPSYIPYITSPASIRGGAGADGDDAANSNAAHYYVNNMRTTNSTVCDLRLSADRAAQALVAKGPWWEQRNVSGTWAPITTDSLAAIIEEAYGRALSTRGGAPVSSTHTHSGAAIVLRFEFGANGGGPTSATLTRPTLGNMVRALRRVNPIAPDA